jgi:hypothetical protein
VWARRFDKVLVDDRIVRLVPQLLGKPFYKKKKLPVPVNLVASKLKEEVRILRTIIKRLYAISYLFLPERAY